MYRSMIQITALLVLLLSLAEGRLRYYGHAPKLPKVRLEDNNSQGEQPNLGSVPQTRQPETSNQQEPAMMNMYFNQVEPGSTPQRFPSYESVPQTGSSPQYSSFNSRPPPAYSYNSGPQRVSDFQYSAYNAAPQNPFAPQSSSFDSMPQGPSSSQFSSYNPAPQSPASSQFSSYNSGSQAPSSSQFSSYNSGSQAPSSSPFSSFNSEPQAPGSSQFSSYNLAAQIPISPPVTNYNAAAQNPVPSQYTTYDSPPRRLSNPQYSSPYDSVDQRFSAPQYSSYDAAPQGPPRNVYSPYEAVSQLKDSSAGFPQIQKLFNEFQHGNTGNSVQYFHQLAPNQGSLGTTGNWPAYQGDRAASATSWTQPFAQMLYRYKRR